jgi:S1-C subfamily serine protease
MIWFAAVLPGPCQKIKPQMEQLRAQGYPVRIVDVPSTVPQGHLAATWQIESLPQWVLLKNGKPVTRFKGAGAAKNIASRIEAELTPRFMAATVRIRVKYGGKVEYATGTCVANNDGHSLILTCAHCVDQAPKEAEVLVQTWGGGGKWKDYRAEVLDTGLLRIQGVLASVNVGNRNPVRGHVVLTVGCSMSKPPTVQRTTINGLNRYVGPDNIETSVAPASGRSGGGLFNLQGELVGVCSAADRQRGVGLGLYAGPGLVETLGNDRQGVHHGRREADDERGPDMPVRVRLGWLSVRLWSVSDTADTTDDHAASHHGERRQGWPRRH